MICLLKHVIDRGIRVKIWVCFRPVMTRWGLHGTPLRSQTAVNLAKEPAVTKRSKILLGMVAGVLWALGLLWIGAGLDLPVFTLIPTILGAFLAPGLVMMLMVGRLAQRRFFDDAVIDGDAFASGSAADIDQRVLRNTVEQLVLALCIWPAAAVILQGDGPGVIVALGLGFAVARLAFWVGYHLSPPLRAFGFGASFYPTVAVSGWSLWRLLASFSVA